MEPTKNNNASNEKDDQDDPTPKLESSPIPILFVPFNSKECKCSFCGSSYSETSLLKQKWCKPCLLDYIKGTNNTEGKRYLDVHIINNNNNNNNQQCIKHKTIRDKTFYTNNIQEWCEDCSEISYFKQIFSATTFIHTDLKKNCESCEKLIFNNNNDKDLFEYIFCSCYRLFPGRIESKSTLIKKSIPILYLPWWDTKSHCIVCNSQLKFIFDGQKWCLNCFIIHVGCRYCLTTNIILGITEQSQCRKCKRISFITIADIVNIGSGNIIIEEFLASTRTNTINYRQIADHINNNKNSNIPNIYNFIRDKLKITANEQNKSNLEVKWIPYSQITNMKEIARGGFGTIYEAKVKNRDETVAIKRFSDSRDISSDFLNELTLLYQCYDWSYVIQCFGITQDPITEDHMLIMLYADGGDLHDYLRKNITNITWDQKLSILQKISRGLESIHEKNFIHRDFHSGNILSSLNATSYRSWFIADLGLSQPANNDLSNNEIYGVIPYIAPEIFNGTSSLSKESDIYSMGMIMWELTTGRKPFADIDHDVNLILKILDGKRPEITIDTPECFANLMKKCWDPDPAKRSSMTEVRKTIFEWCYVEKYKEPFKQAEKRRLELIQSKKLSPEFAEKYHPKAIYKSRALSSTISKARKFSECISTSMISFKRQEYISKDYEYDINSIQSTPSRKKDSSELDINNIQSSPSQNKNSSESDTNNVQREHEHDINDIQREYEFDINNNQSSPSRNSESDTNNIQSSPSRNKNSSSKKRNIDELKIETHSNGKNVKIDNGLDLESQD